ncbi:hypothetical protein [Bradyrhizobium tunisiense]|uniref:hypothetical protein n=1 Tax=Bradyrhizobium tunisiense TaxID=3278709 RepID=UPI0035DA1181
MIDSTHIKADRLAAVGTEGVKADYLCSPGGRNSKIHATETAGARLITLLLTGGEAHGYPIAKHLIRRAPKHMQPTTTTNCARNWRARNEAGDSKPQQRYPTVLLRQAPVQASLVRERIQQAQGLQAHRNSL